MDRALPSQASFRDRTNEFRAAVESARRRAGPSFLNGSSAANAAASIRRGIDETTSKIDELAELVKNTSVFCNHTVGIQDLTAVIKKDITALNADLVNLQVWNSQNKTGNLSKDTTNHFSAVVDDLTKRLMYVTTKFENGTKPIEVHVVERWQMFSPSTAKDASNPFIRQGPLVARDPSWASDSASTQLFQRKRIYGGHGASSSSQPFVQQQQLAVQQDSYMQSRAEDLRNLNRTIHEISNVHTQLNTMVSQQGELAIRIDEYMEETKTNVEGAQGQLLKYLNSIPSNMWLMMKIFFLLMVFLMIFIFFVA